MDTVRLGRALGYGTRHAAKTISAVVEAAATPDPKPNPAEPEPPPSAHPRSTPPQAAKPAASSGGPRRPAAGTVHLAHGVRHFGRSIWGPLALFSGVLWLRVTGLFFGLIAAAMGEGAWRLRWALKAGEGTAQAHRFWVFALFAGLFGYFAVSSFVRAGMKERRALAASR